MQIQRNARFIAIALLFLASRNAFAQLPEPPPQKREVIAGDVYSDVRRVVCVLGGGGTVTVRARVSPNLFSLNVTPSTVAVGSLITISGRVPITTPAQPYTVTLEGINTSSNCTDNSENFTLFVREPVRLTIDPSIQIVAPGSSGTFPVRIRRRTDFPGEVTLSTSGLPQGFVPTFNPPKTTGNSSDLTVQVPANTTQCLPPQGCRFKIDGMASVQVESANAQLVILGVVSLEPDQTMVTVEPGREAVFRLKVNRLNYTGPVELAVTPMEQPTNGKFTTRIVNTNFDVIFSSRLSWTNLIQYDNVSEIMGLNLRLNWIPEAGREIYFVVNHNLQDFDEDNSFRSLASDVVAKASYTFRF